MEGRKKLCQGEANMGSRKAHFVVASGEGKACGEHGSQGRGRRHIKLGSNEATSPAQEAARSEKRVFRNTGHGQQECGLKLSKYYT